MIFNQRASTLAQLRPELLQAAAGAAGAGAGAAGAGAGAAGASAVGAAAHAEEDADGGGSEGNEGGKRKRAPARRESRTKNKLPCAVVSLHPECTMNYALSKFRTDNSPKFHQGLPTRFINDLTLIS